MGFGQEAATREGRHTMTPTLMHERSPLAQARRGRQVALKGASRQLSEKDQAVLTEILASEKYDYVDNELFTKRNAHRAIFEDAPDITKPDTSWYHPVMDNATESRATSNVKPVLLTAIQERALFIQFNYCRFMVAELKKKVGDSPVTADLARRILEWHYRADAYRDQIAQTNLALVLAMAKRTRMSDVDFTDLVSEGNMALLRAVDKFDAARGFKFSTYGCRAILKAFSRIGMKHSKYRQMFPTDFDPKMERSDYMERRREGHEADCADEIRLIVKENRAELTDIEQEVIEHRFAVGHRRDEDPEAQPLTLEQVGRIIGVTKERVRQIQNKALVKIRQTLEEGYLD